MKIKLNYALLEKILVTLGFILVLAASTIIARTPVASSYEISIYAAYPDYFWLLIIATIFLGLSALWLRSFVIPQSERSYPAGFILLIITNLIIILLPVFRGYYLPSGGDQIGHFGMIKNLLVTGHFGISNIYPVSHIISTDILLLTGFDIRTVMYMLPPLFYLIYILGIVLLARVVCQDHRATYLVMAAGSVLLFTYFNYLFFPTQNIVFLLPLILFLFIKANLYTSANYGVILIVLLISAPFVHPLGSLLIALILTLFVVADFIFRRLTALRQKDANLPAIPSFSFISSVLVFVVFFIWFSRFDAFRSSVRNAILWLFSGEGTPPIEKIIEGVEKIRYSIIDLVIRISLNDGQAIIYGLLAVSAIFFILFKHFQKQRNLSIFDIFLTLSFIGLFLYAAGSIFGNYIGTGSSLRLFCWALFISILLIGTVFHEWISTSTGFRKFFLASMLLGGIFISAIIGVFNTYFSPVIDNGDAQVPYSAWKSQEWFHTHKADLPTVTFDQLTKHATGAIYGKDAPKPFQIDYYFPVPERLNYTESTKLKDILARDFYTVVNHRVIEVKKNISPDRGIYYLEDLAKMFADNHNLLVYTSAENNHVLLIKQGKKK